MSRTQSPSTTEQVQHRLREVLAELRVESEQDRSQNQYHAFWLTRMAEAVSAEYAECLLFTGEGRWESVGDVGTRPQDEATQQLHAEALQDVSATMRPVIQGVPTRTTITYPIIVVGQLRGAVRFELDFESEAAQQGCKRFIGDAIESLERFHILDDRRESIERLAVVEQERRLTDAVHADLRLAPTAFVLANEGRLVVGCDRLSVLMRRGGRYRLTAVSGQDDVNRRTSAAHLLEAITRRCVATGDVVVFPNKNEYAADFVRSLEDYVDESHVKRLVVVPLIKSHAAAELASKLEPPRPVGAIVMEYFGETAPRPDERRLIEVVASRGAAALYNATRYDAIFLAPVWQRLGTWRAAMFEPGSRRRTILVLAALGAALTALAVVPQEFTAYCRGTLNPVERRRIFAPLDGTVQKIAVKHGDRVERGQVLIELRNTDLDIASADVAGRRTASAEQLTAIERTLFDEAKRITAEERARLSGERSQIREQIASLDRQLELYAEQRKLLSITSPIDGEVITWNPGDLLDNRPVRLGQQLLTVAAVGGPWELELRVPDDRSGRVVEAAKVSGEPLLVSYSPAVDPGVVRTGRVMEIEKSAELREDDGNTVLVRVAVQADDLPQRRPGAEVAANIHCGTRPIGYVWFYDIISSIRSRILFRWF